MIDSILRAVFVSQWVVLIVVGALLLCAADLGYRSGLQLHRAKDERRKGLIPGSQGAVLGLLGLLLGFTFAIAASRYELRRNLVLAESNAIGTAYLRASFLPEAHRDKAQGLFRRYVDSRLDFYSAGADEGAQRAAEASTAEIQRGLWSEAVASGEEKPTPLVSLFVGALNEVIDVDAMRVAALHAHVPGAVWLLVFAVASAGCWATGYQAGATGVRSTLTHVLLPLLVAVVVTLIADLDRPRGGLIGISQEPMVELKASLGKG